MDFPQPLKQLVCDCLDHSISLFIYQPHVLLLLLLQIAFTGSTEVGRRIGAEAAKSLKPCTLELGGKSPVIVCPGLWGAGGGPG